MKSKFEILPFVIVLFFLSTLNSFAQEKNNTGLITGLAVTGFVLGGGTGLASESLEKMKASAAKGDVILAEFTKGAKALTEKEYETVLNDLSSTLQKGDNIKIEFEARGEFAKSRGVQFAEEAGYRRANNWDSKGASGLWEAEAKLAKTPATKFVPKIYVRPLTVQFESVSVAGLKYALKDIRDANLKGQASFLKITKEELILTSEYKVLNGVSTFTGLVGVGSLIAALVEGVSGKISKTVNRLKADNSNRSDGKAVEPIATKGLLARVQGT